MSVVRVVANELLIELLNCLSIIASRFSVHASIGEQDRSEVERHNILNAFVSHGFEKTDLDQSTENTQVEGMDRVGMQAIVLSLRHARYPRSPLKPPP